jgi:hypothetical protein
LRNIYLDDSFEVAFQAVESVRLEQLEAQEARALAIVAEQRANETQYIQLLAERQRVLVEAETAVRSAELAYSARTTAESTDAARRLIEAESLRNTVLVQARANVSKALAEREASVTDTSRLAEEQRLQALRAREVALIEAQSLVDEALARRAGLVSQAQAGLDEARSLTAQALTAVDAEAHVIALQANATALATQERTAADVDALQASRATQREEFEQLAAAAGMSTEEVLQYAWTEVLLKRSDSGTVFLDYERSPMALEVSGEAEVSVGGSVVV